jgi:excisionase family DNA binding protein
MHLVPKQTVVGGDHKLDGRSGEFVVNSLCEPERTSSELPLLKPSEVAAQLGVSRSWLYDAAKTGRIPSIRIGGEEGPLRFVPEDIARWIDDARARWTPGHPTVATRRLAVSDGNGRGMRSQPPRTHLSGQQGLFSDA